MFKIKNAPSRDFMADALCVEAVENGIVTHDSFFAAKGSDEAGIAATVCAACPINEECATYADELQVADSSHDVVGVWGGVFR
jgi:uncharacterized protein YciW